jgi:hypothetical protein
MEVEYMQTTDTPEAGLSVTRRRLLALVGWGSFAAFWGSMVLATLRFFFPRILYEPSPLFQAGKPGDYHTTWKVMSQISDALKHFSCEIKGL